MLDSITYQRLNYYPRNKPLKLSYNFLHLWFCQISSEPADGNVVVKKGSSVSIKCGASGNPKPTVTWSKLNEAEVMGHGEVMQLSEVIDYLLSKVFEGLFWICILHIFNLMFNMPIAFWF